jgi:hypothetical protein
MRDRRLEKNIIRVEAFVEKWKQLSQFLDRGFQGDSFTAEEEAAFLDLKSIIAQEHELLMTTLGTEADRSDKGLRLLNNIQSLQALRELPEGTDKRLTAEWHNFYLWLQALLGRLRGQQAQLATISSFSVGLRNVFANPLVLVIVAVFAVYGVYRLAADWIPKIYQAVEQETGEKKP